MATTKKNSVDEFIEMNTDDTSSFAESDQRESQLLAELEALSEREFPASSDSDERERADAQNRELLQALLSRYPQTDETIRRIVSEVVNGFARYNAPAGVPPDSPEVKQLKARIAVLKGYYPVTWV